ncbi:lipid droplet-associated hydrolase-like [Schistocerca piceifrons]|uniref:lipid droplet-associated hydrolase-like n=1 Tax=Schistocerca piceifrons TaxID=274613 RepID=UPI001F5EDF0A|nr:lipid droplet-associated hydrolase-like [Schistocerca piceifrons]
MQDEFVKIGATPTHIATWGIGKKEEIQNCEELVLLIPGNPGLIGYYKEFLDTVYKNLKMPLCVISHAGHELPTGSVTAVDGQQSYDLDFQTQHKIEFINKYVPSNIRLYLVGHSIGCKIILNMLKNEDIDKRVVKCYLLFPTVERMAESPNGKFLTKFVLPIVPIILFLSWIFTLFPSKIQYCLLYLYFLIRGSGSDASDVTRQLINPQILRNVFSLADDEMNTVQELDHHVVDLHKDKLFFYYGATDNWTPVSYFEQLLKLHPNVKAQLCSNNFEHAFVLSSANEVGMYVSELIKSDKLKCNGI